MNEQASAEAKDTRLRILHLIATADPRTGGPIEGIVRSSAALARLGHYREVATLDHPDDPWIRDFPLPVFPLGERPARVRAQLNWLPWVHYGHAPRFVPWLRSHAHEYDAVIVNGLWNYCAAAAAKVLPGSKNRYFVFTHGMLDPWFRRTYPVKTFLKQISWWLHEGPLLAGAQAVLFTCEEERILARHAFTPYKVNEVVVGYGTSDVTGEPATQIAAFEQRIPALAGKRFLLFLSRIHPKKGCDLLIEAFAKIAVREPDLDLVIAGPDETGWTAKLQEQARQRGISGRVHWPGMLQGDEKWGAFHASEAFILPSHQENFGIVVAEALACSRPVLITNKVNIWREIEEDGAGYVGSDDVDGISDIMSRFLSLSTDERRRMGAVARGSFVRRFDIENNVKDLVAAITAGSL